MGEMKSSGAIRTLPHWERFLFGLLGASIVSVPPIWVAWQHATVPALTKAAQPVTEAALIAFILAFVAAVSLATRIEAHHPYESFFTGLGIPGIVLSGAVATQGIF